MRKKLAILLSCLAAGAIATTVVVGTDDGPEGPLALLDVEVEWANYYFVDDGDLGGSTIRINYRNFDNYPEVRVMSKTPGTAGLGTETDCPEDDPNEFSGNPTCVVTGLATGNHFLTIQGRTDSSLPWITFDHSWHTVGPETDIRSGEDTLGTWEPGELEAAYDDNGIATLTFPAYTAPDPDVPTVGYYVFETSDANPDYSLSPLQTYVSSSTSEYSEFDVAPFTENGLIYDLRYIQIGERTQVLYDYYYANTVNEIVTSEMYTDDLDAPILRLYQAYFDRSPDVDGAIYWLDIRREGYDILDIARFMADSTEFRNVYTGTTDAEYVELIYQNVLGRDYDVDGFDYWLGLVKAGELGRPELVFYVTQGDEFIATYPFTKASVEAGTSSKQTTSARRVERPVGGLPVFNR